MFPQGDVNHTCSCSITHSFWARKAACTGLGVLPSVIPPLGQVLLHPRPLDWRRRMKCYSTYYHAPLWVQNLLFLVPPFPLMDLQLTACKLNATCCLFPVCCDTPLMPLFPIWGFFPWPSEFQGTMESSCSKSSQRFPGIADGIFKSVSVAAPSHLGTSTKSIITHEATLQ